MNFKFFFIILFFFNFLFVKSQLKKNDVNYSFSPKIDNFRFDNFTEVDDLNYKGEYTYKLKLFEQDLFYNPTLSYQTRGIKVNDSGGRNGINWNNNFDAIIYRVINAKPDELISSRISNFDGNITEQNYQLIDNYERTLSNKDYAGADAEYDLFSYNLFGNSGSFLLVNGKVELIDKSDINITIIKDYPLLFKIVDTKGNTYFFDNESNVETVNLDSESYCDRFSGRGFGFVPVKWFVNKIKTFNNDEYNFKYINIEPYEVRDFNETIIFKDRFYNDDIYPCGASQSQTYTTVEPTYCTRAYEIKTKLISEIMSPNYQLFFNYIDREDIYQDKLLSQIILKNKFNKEIENIHFSYDKISSNLLNNVNIISSLQKGLDIRYFLKEITFTNQKKYSFGYLNPNSLPPRFSNSQDLLGYANNKNNSSLIPKEYINKASLPYSIFASFYNQIPRGDRSVEPTVSQSGMLNKIIFPTKGYDLIEYESNLIKAKDEIRTKNEYSGKIISPWIEHFGETPEFKALYDETIDFKISAYNEEYGENAVNFKFYDVTNEVYITNGRSVFANDNYSSSVEIKKGHVYRIDYEMIGTNTVFYYDLKYTTEFKIVEVDKPYYGIRVKKIIKNDNLKNNVYEFSYKSFEEENLKLVYNDSPSYLVDMEDFKIDNSGGGFISEYFEQYTPPSGGCWNPPMPPAFNSFDRVNFYKISSNSIYNLTPYNNSEILYKNITKLHYSNGSDEKNFIAKTFIPNQNIMAKLVLGKHRLSNNIDNNGWNIGSISSTYLGKIKDGNSFQIVKKIKNNYDFKIYNTYNNYTVHRGGTVFNVLNSDLDTKFKPLSVSEYKIHTYWYNNVGEEITDYVDNGTSISTKNNYNYNSTNHSQLTKQIIQNSKGETLTTEYQYPPDLVGQEDYMKELTDANRIAEPVIVKQSVDDVYISEVHNQYNLFNGIVQKAAVHQKKGNGININTIIDRKITYNSYDTQGNLTQYTLENGIPVSIIWGYGGQYPIAKIEGASLSEVSSFIQNLEIASNNGTLTKDSFASLRTALPQAMITSYIYQPLVGVTSITGPNWISP
ncbi:hypothetical protein [Empedobacter sp. UBA7494]|uniref:hypothetical protein n=1 Tax=Empedobacter sp. UBA7494 TaxID=1946450 RepID=UPI0025C4C4BC|nr:hypothetical protein [Empedobacter sp. UBA7494]